MREEGEQQKPDIYNKTHPSLDSPLRVGDGLRDLFVELPTIDEEVALDGDAATTSAGKRGSLRQRQML